MKQWEARYDGGDKSYFAKAMPCHVDLDRDSSLDSRIDDMQSISYSKSDWNKPPTPKKRQGKGE